MLYYWIKILSYVLLLALITDGCAAPHISDVRIERFEKIDEQPRIECYLVYGYHKSIEQEVGKLIDIYVCDSIFPNIKIDSTYAFQKKVLYFFKRSKNSNNTETYRSKIKRSIAYRDIIFEYVFDIGEDFTVTPSQKNYRVNDPDMIMESFRCN